MKSWQFVALTSIMPLCAGFASGVLFQQYRETTQSPSSAAILSETSGETWNGVSMKKLGQVENLLKKNYINPQDITSEKLEEWMIRGILYSVEDPYTEYFNEKQSEEFSKNLQGDFEGVGAALEKQKEKVTITEVMKGRPAADAGLLPGDIILSVDGKTVENETIYKTVDRIRGKKGTTVELEIYRNGEVKKYNITRANIHVENVTFEMKGDIGVLEVNQFGETLEDEFKTAFKEMKAKNPKGIVVDMRYNGGGYMEGAVALASYFLPERTKVMSMQERDKPVKDSFTTVQSLNDTTTPMVVLVNGGSASAAEIFAASMQESNRAQLVGEKTFGKGVVQQMFPLSFGSDEMVKITIAKWLTPSGKNVTHDEPLTPDVLVKWDKSSMTDEQKATKHDPQMEKAIALLSK